jgi:uncharacterized BrkB/YihY/UPF0761 family membrane protein
MTRHSTSMRVLCTAGLVGLLAVYYSAQILLLGAEFAKAHSDQRRARVVLRGTTRAVS